jgi:hypothetical protein
MRFLGNHLLFDAANFCFKPLITSSDGTYSPVPRACSRDAMPLLDAQSLLLISGGGDGDAAVSVHFPPYKNAIDLS